MVESAVDKERAEFEKWASKVGYSLRRFERETQDELGEYYYDCTRSAWKGWQACAAAMRATLAERDAEVERLKGLVYAPGEMRCAKCKFVLLRRTMFVRSGTIGAGSNETKPCPNGCGPLWSRTWKDVAVETGERLEEMFAFADLQAARAALSDQPQHQGDGR